MTTPGQNTEVKKSRGWQSMVSIIMVLSGCACFILAIVAGMAISRDK